MRYVASDEYWLSPMYERNIGVISMIVFGNATYGGDITEFEMYGHGLENIAKKYNGRPHWGKQNYIDSIYLKSVYPQFDEFCEFRKIFDPINMFINDYLTERLDV